ncbi:hypothetical protein BDV95DRAFT_351819 [Massariosphaeria phaeospora]|uniref:FAD-binding PCMH-type domain-containing protein n=1 Tax=Massariosphaeria phaeospora TaxID=100035 RepID=A0A7C8MAM7_9PLEO|nr:hypothetical protein BDV95DRAFT_351819 [Massariosphaeria phaeospora]
MDTEQLLDKAVPGKVLLPGSEPYDTSNASYFASFASAIKPAFIVQPTSTQDVSSLMKALGPALKQQKLLLAVRGTGHTPIAGSANIQDGVTMDLRGLKGISLNGDKSVVEIGVGETWGSVYGELEKHGVTTAGGRVGRVGVGGLVLGGGLSLYSTRRGFACDSVIDFEVILASGELVHANANENPDLWISLRGGLNNFGIVTAFKMNTFELGPIWGGVTYYMPDAFSQLVHATVDFVNNEVDEDTHIMSSAGYAFGNHVATCCMYQTKGLENPPSLQRFTSLPHQIEGYGTMRTSTHIDFCNELSNFTKDGVRSFYATLTIRPDPALMNELHQAWLQTLEPLKDAEGLILSLGFFPLTKALLQNSQKAGGNAKDIDPADGPLLIFFINPTWNSPEDDKRIHEGVEQLLAKCKHLAREKGLLHRYLFTNYAYYQEHVFKGYGEESLARLLETSKKFDTEQIFQTAVPGGFKLSASG